MNRSLILGLKGSGALLAAASLASCSGSGTSPQSVTVQSPLSGVLKMAVGTANIYGDSPAVATTGTNVVVTFRQPSGGTEPGGTAALVNSPTLSGPWTLPAAVAVSSPLFGATILNGPTAAEAGTNTITSTVQQNPGTPTSAIPNSSFGDSTGVTGLGLEPFNYTATGGTSTGGSSVNFGAPDSYVPYYVPVYDAAGSNDANRARPWGGPPAFDPDKNGKGTRDGSGFPSAVVGVEEGIDVFQGTGPTAGTYTLAVNVPTGQSTNGNASTTAALSSTALLPAVSFPGLPALDGKGGGTFALTLPAGVTEAYIQIRDLGPTTTDATSCNGATAAAPVYYTLFANASGLYTLPDTDGPGLPTSTNPSLCNATQNAAVSTLMTGDPAPDGDSFSVQIYGFDYPAYEASYPRSTGNPNPTLAGPSGQSDISISSMATFTQPAGPATTVLRI